MAKLLIVDPRGCTKELSVKISNRLQHKGLSLEMKLERGYYPETISPDHDIYLLHLSGIGLDAISKLREQNPAAFVIGMSDMCAAEPRMEERFKGLLDAYTERNSSDRNLNVLTSLIYPRINKK